MSFLKISGLVIGTGSVVGGTGAGIYYAVKKNNSEESTQKSNDKPNAKTEFTGKLVFEKKDPDDSNSNYSIKLLTKTQYDGKEQEFNNQKTEAIKKYASVNKVVDISYELNISEAEAKLKEIFGESISLTDAKTTVLNEKAGDLKELFGEKIYEDLKSKLET